MPQEVICPHCRQLVLLDEPTAAPDTLVSLEAHHTIETIIPGTLCNDDHPADSNGTATTRATEVRHHPPAPIPQIGSSDFDPLDSPVPDPVLEAFVHDESGEMAPPATPVAAPPVAPSQDGNDAPPPSTLLVLLASYASAATVALAYLLWNGYGRPSPRPTVAESSVPDPAKRAASLAPLAEDRMTRVGQALTVGDLEITPIEIRKGRVRFRRAGSSPALGDPDADSLLIGLRLKNLGKDATFVPLEPAFVRNPDRGFADAVIQVDGGPLIDTFPLAVASERSLVGQAFGPLKPGEVRETLVASEPGVEDKMGDAMTWRLKLRVDPDHEATIGVAFGRSDVK